MRAETAEARETARKSAAGVEGAVACAPRARAGHAAVGGGGGGRPGANAVNLALSGNDARAW